jgi:pimeloyl-ACP methyl ester carboxylesterase
MKDVVGYNLNDITIMGRSIGSGPAVYLASIYPVGSLILLSPFLSIQEAVRDLYGEICSRLIKQRFNNK